MHQTTMRSTDVYLASLVPVTNLDALDDFIRQSEIDSGQPGRDFLVGGAERLTYQVRLQPTGYEIRRSDAPGMPAVHATRFELGNHLLGHALIEGYLFTTRMQ